jgi:hypothetical protein
MNSVFQYTKSQSQDRQNTIDHGVYVSSFERAVGATPVTLPTKKRKSMSTQTEFKTPPDASDNDIVGREPCVQKRPRFDTVLESCDKEDEDVGLYCYENSDEIFEDLDMEKQLGEMTVLPVQKEVWVNGSEFQHIQGSHKVDLAIVDMYSSFQHWGTDKSPSAHSISQLY